jgi:hypothetical protein
MAPASPHEPKKAFSALQIMREFSFVYPSSGTILSIVGARGDSCLFLDRSSKFAPESSQVPFLSLTLIHSISSSNSSPFFLDLFLAA